MPEPSKGHGFSRAINNPRKARTLLPQNRAPGERSLLAGVVKPERSRRRSD